MADLGQPKWAMPQWMRETTGFKVRTTANQTSIDARIQGSDVT
jgi:hypothetical protein